MAACAINPIAQSIMPNDFAVNGRGNITNYQMTLNHKGNENSLIIYQEKTPSSFSIVAIGSLGTPLFSCAMGVGGSENKQCDMIDPNIPAGKLFDDMMLILTPTDVLHTRLFDHFNIVEIDKNRKIFRNDLLFIDIEYIGQNDILFTHHIYDYTFKLQALNVDE